MSGAISEKLTKCAQKTITHFKEKLKDDGSLDIKSDDICCYYKLPMILVTAQEAELAKKVVAYTHKQFMKENGDFGNDKINNSGKTSKSIKPEYVDYWTYTNGWILRAAQKLGLKNVSEPAYKYMLQFQLKDNQGFLTNNPDANNKVTDVFTAAHHGLIHLERGNLDAAKEAGNYICNCLDKQPAMDKSFYLRFDAAGKPITTFEKARAPFYVVQKSEPDQLYFMIGYPCAYLAMLYKKTKEEKFLTAAEAYLNFALTCHKSVYASNFSHKIAWAASILYDITGKKEYLSAIQQITDYFIGMQSEEGLWFSGDANSAYDQSAEIACWFLDIANNLNQKELTDKKTLTTKKALSSATAGITSLGVMPKPKGSEGKDDSSSTVTFVPANQMS